MFYSVLKRLFASKWHLHVIYYTKQQLSGQDKSEPVIIDGGNA